MYAIPSLNMSQFQAGMDLKGTSAIASLELGMEQSRGLPGT